MPVVFEEIPPVSHGSDIVLKYFFLNLIVFDTRNAM